MFRWKLYGVQWPKLFVFYEEFLAERFFDFCIYLYIIVIHILLDDHTVDLPRVTTRICSWIVSVLPLFITTYSSILVDYFLGSAAALSIGFHFKMNLIMSWAHFSCIVVVVVVGDALSWYISLTGWTEWNDAVHTIGVRLVEIVRCRARPLNRSSPTWVIVPVGCMNLPTFYVNHNKSIHLSLATVEANCHRIIKKVYRYDWLFHLKSITGEMTSSHKLRIIKRHHRLNKELAS